MLQKLNPWVAEAWAQAAAAESAAKTATPNAQDDYESLARRWRRIAEVWHFVERLDRFLLIADKHKSVQAPDDSSSAPPGLTVEELRQHLANIVESSDDPIVSKDLNGIVMSWNRAAQRVFGYSVEEAVGKSIAVLIPPELKNDEDFILEHIRRGERIEHYDTRRRRKDGTDIDVSLTVSPIRDAAGRIVGASKIARDITDQKRAREQIAADLRAMTLLRQLGGQSVQKDIAVERCLQDYVEAAIAIASADKGNLQVLDPDSGALFIAAQSGFDKPFLEFFAQVSDGASACATAMKTAERIIVDDVMTSSIFVGQPSQRILLEAGVRSVTSTPLISGDATVFGMISVHFAKPHWPSDRELGLIDLLSRQVADYLERKRNEEVREMLLEEMQHRTNNLLAVVQGVAHGSLSGDRTLAEAKAAFDARLRALARTNRHLTGSKGSPLHDIVRLELEAFTSQASTDGVALIVGPRYAQCFSLALHELATNAVKYGALSSAGGKVEISWRIEDAAENAMLKFKWQEFGGPRVQTPSRKGFGTSLLQATFHDVRLNYASEGLICEFDALLDRVTGKRSGIGAPI